MNFKAVLAVSVFGIAFLTTVLAQSKPAATGLASSTTGTASNPAVDTTDIDRLIARLGDDTFAEREKAQQALLKIGLPAVSALTRAAASSDPEIAVRAKNIKEQIISEAFVAKVGNVTIHLTGVSSRPAGPTSWWLPNGMPLESPPANATPAPSGSSDLLFGVEVIGPEGMNVQVLVNPCRGGQSSNGGSEGLKDGLSRFWCFQGRSLATGAETAIIDVRIEQGQWQSVANVAPGKTAKDPSGQEVTVGALTQKGERLEATCTYRADDGWQYRLMIVKTDGSEMESGSSSYMKDKVRRATLSWGGMQAADVAGVRVDRRAIEWVRFENISIARGRLTEVPPARKISSDRAGKTPLPPEVRPVDPKLLGKDEAQAAGVALRFLTALNAGEIENAKALSLGSVVGWPSEQELRDSPAKVLVGLWKEGLAKVGDELRKDIKYPGGRPQAGRPALQGDFAGVPFQVEGQDQYLLVLLKRTQQDWRLVTLDNAKGTVAGETAKAAERVTKALASLAGATTGPSPATSQPASGESAAVYSAVRAFIATKEFRQSVATSQPNQDISAISDEALKQGTLELLVVLGPEDFRRAYVAASVADRHFLIVLESQGDGWKVTKCENQTEDQLSQMRQRLNPSGPRATPSTRPTTQLAEGDSASALAVARQYLLTKGSSETASTSQPTDALKEISQDILRTAKLELILVEEHGGIKLAGVLATLPDRRFWIVLGSHGDAWHVRGCESLTEEQLRQLRQQVGSTSPQPAAFTRAGASTQPAMQPAR